MTNMGGMFSGDGVTAMIFDQDIRDWSVSNGDNLVAMFSNSDAMIARFDGVTGFDVDAGAAVTPSAAFFNQGDVSTLDGFTGVTTTETFVTSTQNYTATATPGTLVLGLDLSRPRGTAAVTLEKGGVTSSVSVGTPNALTGMTALARVALTGGDDVFTITVTSPDTSTSTTYTLTVTTDGAGVVPSIGSLTVDEGSTTTFTVALSATPTAGVTVTPSVSDASEVRFSPASLSFSTGNWNAAQTVTVAGVYDTIIDGTQTSILTLTAASTDGDYSGITSTVDVSVTDVATTTLAAMDNTIFARAMADATYVANCINTAAQGDVAKGAALAHHCVYYEGTTNYGHISDWNTSAVTDMSFAFKDRSNFNQDISGWDVSNVTTMLGLFQNATRFNQDISGWNTARVTLMNFMFHDAAAFNQDIGGWNTGAVTSFSTMFDGAVAFNQDIGDWSIGSSASLSNMFTDATAMIARFGSVAGFDSDGAASAAVTPLASFFNKGGISTLDGITGVPLAETFVDSITSYTATATAGALALGIDLTRPKATVAVTLEQGGATSSVIVGAIDPITGVAALNSVTIATGENKFTITVTSPDTSTSTTYTLTVRTVGAGIATSAGSLTVAEGSIATFTVALSATPTAGVTVTPSLSDARQVIFRPASLSFSTSTWNTPQTVTVIGVYDAFTDGTQTSTLTLTASSTDGDYSGITSIVDISATDVTTPTPAAMDDTIFARALANTALINNCINTAAQGNVVKGTASANRCVYYEDTTNYGHISEWNTSAVTDMSNAFLNRTNFNQDISGWDVSNVTSMANMFRSSGFNQPIGVWQTDSLQDMTSMFNGTLFNQDIGGWNTSNVTSTVGLFLNNTAFNQDIRGWDTASVTRMDSMFNGATIFDQDIRDWDTGSVDSARYTGMFTGATAMIARFDGVTGFDSDGATSAAVTPLSTFFNQGDVSTLDGITGVTTTETFVTSTTSYTATATAGTLALSLDLSRPTGAVAVTLEKGGVTSSVSVGTPNALTGIAALDRVTLAGGDNVFTITVTSPDTSTSTTYTLTVTTDGVGVVPSTGSLTVAEGSTATFTVALERHPNGGRHRDTQPQRCQTSDIQTCQLEL